MSTREDSRIGPSGGVVLLDKPVGISSFAALGGVKRVFATRKVGHTGTLDPFATGLLLALVGPATRCTRYFGGLEKRYSAVFAFGTETSTDDCTGSVTRTAPLVEWSCVRGYLEEFTGEIEQIPPQYSAVHVSGQRAHALARKGAQVTLRPRKVTIYELSVSPLTERELEVTIRCSAGTYVRSLARDLARRVGSAAHVSELRRTAIGAFSVEDAVAAGNVTLADRRPLRDALLRLPDVTEVPVSESVASLVRNGGALSADELGPGQGTLLVTHRDVPLAIGELREGRFNYGVVFPQQLRDARRLVDD